MPQTVNPIPEGFHTLTPHLSVTGATAFADFLKRAFGAVEVSRMPGPGGKLLHAHFRIGDSALMFGEEMGVECGMPPLAQGRLPFAFHVYVPDVDTAWKTAVAAGCKVKMPLSDQFWGDRYGQLEDPFGFMWALATHKENLTPAQMQERQNKAFGAGKT
jgi:PhnB protein